MRSPDLIPVLLVAISSNADNVAVGIAYGIRNVRVPLPSNLFIAVFTSCVTLLSTLAGQRIGCYLPPQLANMVGGGIIAGIGVWVLIQSTRSRALDDKTAMAGYIRPGMLPKLLSVLENPLSIDRDLSGHIDLREVCLLAVALSLNNVGNGIGAGMVGMSPLLIATAVLVFSVITLWGGVAAGCYGQRILGNFAKVMSGVLLVAVGVYEIL